MGSALARGVSTSGPHEQVIERLGVVQTSDRLGEGVRDGLNLYGSASIDAISIALGTCRFWAFSWLRLAGTQELGKTRRSCC
jgi:hypothetical protein